MNITLIQFHTTEHTNGYDHVTIGSTYYLNPESTLYEYWIEEDDEGEDIHEELISFQVYDCIDDFNVGRHTYYVSVDGASYSTMTIEVPVDNEGNPILKTT